MIFHFIVLLIVEMSKEFTIKEINELQEQYKTQEDEEHNSMCDQDYSWDIEIDDPEMFMKQLLGVSSLYSIVLKMILLV